ncbi:hypothetical protein QLQ12_39435 [Actinoplanes sp. NEAU-A12]|uniref:Uncharacterized protein n=1 Tax=Actinoplanes sandaracinus TaxID=3045177 RepID=A0ABT6WY63_9ACTN|nr:hypothetical protein [Actinoplanes sandaracinus]
MTTGVLYQDAFLLTYSNQNSDFFAYQVGLASVGSSWGDATRATMTGTTRADGLCVTAGSSFPVQAVYPPRTMRIGESGYTTTATAPGASGICTTWWDVTYTVAGYTPASISLGMNDIRCDNAVGGYLQNPVRVGCVVPWYPAPVYYDSSRNPTLADHVRQAQASGLPGGTVTAPLYRSTDAAVERTNRRLACGNPPSIPGKNCDEYPLATTYNGLSAGGSLRSFPGCNISAPSGSGPLGASACMIAEGDNHAQGGIMSGFYYWERVLDWDPFVVTVL